MQLLLRNDKIIPLLNRRKSRNLVESMAIKVVSKKEKVVKIKQMMKDQGKSAEIVSKELIKDLELKKGNEIISQEMQEQEESFRKKLEDRRSRGKTQPKLRSQFSKNEEIKVEIKEEENKKIIRISNSPVQRKSFLAIQTFNIKEKSVQKKTLNKKNLVLDNDPEIFESLSFVDDILGNSYEDKIESDLIKIWESAEIHLKDQMKEIDKQIEVFLDQLLNEKYIKTSEIKEKYNNECKDFEFNLDLNDENDINTIIYKQIKKDEENEISLLNKDIENRKIIGLAQLREKSNDIKNSFNKMNDISKVKSEISQGIKNKITKSLTPKNNK